MVRTGILDKLKQHRKEKQRERKEERVFKKSIKGDEKRAYQEGYRKSAVKAARAKGIAKGTGGGGFGFAGQAKRIGNFSGNLMGANWIGMGPTRAPSPQRSRLQRRRKGAKARRRSQPSTGLPNLF